MTLVNDTIRGALVITGALDTECFSSLSFEELAKALARIYAVEIPKGLNQIVSGNTEPNEDNRDALWLRRDASGNIVGLYAFQKGTWRLLYQRIEDAVKVEWIYRFDGATPAGFSKVDGTIGNGQIPASVANQLAVQYIQDATNTFDVYFAVTYIGF